MSDALPLPPRPNFEQYKKLAKDLQKLLNAGDDNAVLAWITQWSEDLSQLRGASLPPETRRRLRDQSRRILERWQGSRSDHQPRVNPQAAPCPLSSAQFFIALAHGYASWPKFARHVQDLAQSHSPGARFEQAADAIVNGDAATLAHLLRTHPTLIRERSTREHRSTLLHYVSANGVEDFRQKTPQNIVAITRLLLDAGADVNAESDAYGGGSTALGLVATSVHPERAGLQIELMELLIARGAALQKPGLTGNRHGAVGGCLANGQPRAARFFADRGVRMNFDEAAGVGRLDLVRQYVNPDGGLTPEVSPQQLTDGFLYACGYGHPDVVQFLLQHGTDPRLRKENGETGLHWASFGPHVEVAKLLLQHGAQVDARDKRFNATALDWTLHAWSQAKDAEPRNRACDLVELLVQAGAKFDPAHWSGEHGESPMLAGIRSDARMAAILGNP